MKNRNLFSLVALATMALSGCSNDEVVNDYSPENAIQFGTYVGRDAESRAYAITDANLPTDGFGVFAYYTGQTAFANATDATPNFMYNQKVTGTTTNGETSWSYNPVKYWPNNVDDKVSFFAYAPYSDGGNGQAFSFSGTTATGLPTLDFTVSETVKSQQDLLWAAPVLDQSKNSSNPIDVEEKVVFDFKHALSRIGFEVQAMVDKVNVDKDGDEDDNKGESDSDTQDNGTLADETTIVIKKVTLTGYFDKEGTLTYTPDNNGGYTAAIARKGEAASTKTTYTLQTDQSTHATDFAASQEHAKGTKNEKHTVWGQQVTTEEAKLNADDSYIMIIPKSFTGEDKLTISVEYDVVTEDSNLEKGYSCVTNNISTSFSGVEFEAGKAYKFSLHLGMTSVKLSAKVGDWTVEEDIAVNLPINVEPTKTDEGN